VLKDLFDPLACLDEKHPAWLVIALLACNAGLGPIRIKR